MSFSYSFHLSNKGNALTTTAKVGGASKHNLRLYKSEEYDRNQIVILEGSSDSILDDVKQIYHEEFDEALERYNEKVRPDRRIDDYLNHVSNIKSDVACEVIIQVGDMDFWQDKNLDERQQMTDIFKSQLDDLKELMPDFKIASAVIHYDEKSPHLHVVGVPVHEGYKKGLEKQVAKTKVFTQNSLSMLQDKMRERAQVRMKDMDIFKDMELKEKEKGRNKDIPKYALGEFYEMERTKEHIKEEIKEAEPKLEALKEDFDLKTVQVDMLDGQLREKNKRRRVLDHELEEVSSKIEGSKTELANAEQELERVKSSVQPQIDAYKAVSAGAKDHKAPTIEIGSHEVKDGFMKSHEEIYVKVPCKDVKEAKTLQKEISALYTKQFTDKSLNKSLNGKLATVQKKQRELEQKEAKFEQYKGEQLEMLQEQKAAAIKENNLYRTLTPDKLGLTQQTLERAFKDSVSQSLVDDTIDATIKTLQERGALNKYINPIERVEIRQRVNRTLADKVHDFVDRVKQHLLEKVMKPIVKNRDFDIER